MIQRIPYALAMLFVGAVGVWYAVEAGVPLRFSDTEADFAETPIAGTTTTSLPPIPEPLINGRVQWSAYWRDMSALEREVYATRTVSTTTRVGIQAGHWQLSAVPDELEGLKASSGARGGGYTEQEAVLRIARLVKEILEKDGIVVDLLPATVPVDYQADAFVSIHADGSVSTHTSGYKISGPRRDFSGQADRLVHALYEHYGSSTKLSRDDNNITRRMSGYYAFNWRRYDHALHPLTPAAIIETGFITNAADRRVIVQNPRIAAEGIAAGIKAFLEGK